MIEFRQVINIYKCNNKTFLDGHIRAHESTFIRLRQPTMTSLRILNSAQSRSLIITALVSIRFEFRPLSLCLNILINSGVTQARTMCAYAHCHQAQGAFILRTDDAKSGEDYLISVSPISSQPPRDRRAGYLSLQKTIFWGLNSPSDTEFRNGNCKIK